jgi:CheY-like chemotaxis protein
VTHTRQDSRKINVLLVEDDEVDIINVQRAFQKIESDHPLYVAKHGREALAMLRGSAEDLPTVPRHRRLILLDWKMPRMDGRQFLKELRSDPQLRTTPVIVLTTSDAEEDRLRAFQFNVAGYLLKSSPHAKFAAMMDMIYQYWTLSEMP